MLKRAIIATCVAWISAGSAASGTAITYRVDFEATWSRQTHRNAYPAGAHFASLIDGVHSEPASFWTPGGLASVGIKQLAEFGGTTALRNEVQSAINRGAAAAVLQGGGIVSPGSTSLIFDVSSSFPLVALVTMVAPGPDWFVGVHGLDLRESTGWKSEVTIDLFPYDAATEQGTGFSMSNPDSAPHQAIAPLGLPFAVGDPRRLDRVILADIPPTRVRSASLAQVALPARPEATGAEAELKSLT